MPDETEQPQRDAEGADGPRPSAHQQPVADPHDNVDLGDGRKRQGLVHVLKEILLQPSSWFFGLDPSRTWRAVAFAAFMALVGSTGSALGLALFGAVLGRSATMGSRPTGIGEALVRAIFSALTIPFQIVFIAALLHPLVRITAGRSASFRITMQCVAWSQAARVASIVPIVGPIASFLWSIALMGIGVRAAHRLTWGRGAAIVVVIGGVAMPVGLALGLRQFVVESFRLPASSMVPTLRVGDHLFANKLAYGLGRSVPHRGDVIVFRFPQNRDQDFVKRVIGLPGDTITTRAGDLFINGWRVPSCRAGSWSFDMNDTSARLSGSLFVEYLVDNVYLVFRDDAATNGTRPETGPWHVSPDEVFVLGDNRDNSFDSRLWFGGRGAGVPIDDIRGRASLIWLALGSSGKVDGSRIGTRVMAPPACDPAFPVETCEGIARCLAHGPSPRDATPPKP